MVLPALKGLIKAFFFKMHGVDANQGERVLPRHGQSMTQSVGPQMAKGESALMMALPSALRPR